MGETQGDLMSPATMLYEDIHPRFIIIGAGKMGGAILSGLIASDEPIARDITAEDFVAVNPGAERREFLSETYGVACVADVNQIGTHELLSKYFPKTSEHDDMLTQEKRPLIVILAVKPQVIFDILHEIASLPLFQGGPEGPIFVSIAAGIMLDSISAALPRGSRIVRAMPNMPLVIGAGATGLCVNTASSPEQRYLKLIQGLFACLGAAEMVDEEQLDTVCALSGSGPAYVARFIESLVAASVKQGLSTELASALAVKTVLGTALMLEQCGCSPAELRESVSSPGGTTLAALEALGQAGFESAIEDGVNAAICRAKELAQG